MRAKCYVELIDGVVVAKHAIGPERNPDFTEYYPTPPPNYFEIPFSLYQTIKLEWVQLPDGTFEAPASHGNRPLKLDERLARLEARIQVLEKRGR